MSQPITFTQCVMEFWGNPELMDHYRRLTGSTIGLDTRSPVVRMVDEAAGYQPDIESGAFEAFLGHVYDLVWVRLPADVPREVCPLLLIYSAKMAGGEK